MPERTTRKVVAAALAAAVAFAGSFAVVRLVDDPDAPPAPSTVERLPERVVPVNNLERAPTIKPLRSAPGAPPASAPERPTGSAP